MRIFAIPDIHGRLDLLKALWERLLKEQFLDLTQDKVVFMGDMIDRGPDSKGVLDFIKDLVDTHPNNVIALAGNHEWLAIDAHIKPSYDNEYIWHVNGGLNTLKSFADPYTPGHTPRRMPDDYIKWMAFLPLQHQEPGFFFSHAPVPRENRRNIMYRGTPDFQPEELMWTYDRDEFGVARDHGNGVVGVCGHIHALNKGVMAPRFYDHYIFADAGCGCSSKAPLVAIEVKSREVIYAWP